MATVTYTAEKYTVQLIGAFANYLPHTGAEVLGMISLPNAQGKDVYLIAVPDGQLTDGKKFADAHQIRYPISRWQFDLALDLLRNEGPIKVVANDDSNNRNVFLQTDLESVGEEESSGTRSGL